MKVLKGVQRGSQGFTLVELMITVIVIAVGIALAVPTFDDITQRRQTTAKAEQLASFLSYARTEAVKGNTEVSISLKHNSITDWCVGAMEGNQPCDCEEIDVNEDDFCAVAGITRTLDHSGTPKATMAAYSADITFVFDPVRGTMSEAMDDLANHDFLMESANEHWALQVNIGPTGRVRVCIPDPADYTELDASMKIIPGFKDCKIVSLPIIVIPPSMGG